MGAGPSMRLTESPHPTADIGARFGERAFAGLPGGGRIG